MRSMRRGIFTLSSVLLGCASLMAAVPACSSSSNGFGVDTSTPGFVDPDGGDVDVSSPVGNCPGNHCSRDLKQVLTGCEGQEQVIKQCGDNEACGDAACLPACEAAKLSKGSLGCDFWTIPPEDYEWNMGQCFAAMIANTWSLPINVTAELGTETIDLSQSIYTATKAGPKVTYTKLEGPLPPGEVGLVFLSQSTVMPPSPTKFVKCPFGVTPAVNVDPMKHGTTITQAFHLKTDAPVSAYSIFPYGGAESYTPTATLLLPSSSWGTNYLAINTSRVMIQGGQAPFGMRTLQIVANEDETEVKMRPGIDITGSPTVAPAPKNSVGTWTLSKGQVLQFSQTAELTGSPIETNKPVGVFGGSEQTYIPSNFQAADMTQQQIAPISAWGSEYALVPYRPRIEIANAREKVPFTLVGAADGTTLTYDPARPYGAPETLQAGQSVTFLTDQIVSVRSQGSDHPFHAAVYMTGSTFVSTAVATFGDPDFVTMVPSDQYLDHYVFFADFTYRETSITVVRRKTASGFAPVNLDCAGELSDWQPLGNDGKYEFAWVRLVSGHLPQTFPGGSCNDGRHEIRSDGPFSITVWGIDKDASYGYPGGAGLRPITIVKAPVN
ncbi:IgGFc-binding protein [Labilithrix luteola]|nr:IgGFc-binding protein [Labilithrix luteola]